MTMPAEEVAQFSGGISQVLVEMGRLSGKIDVLTERQGTALNTLTDHETRMRVAEAKIAGEEAGQRAAQAARQTGRDIFARVLSALAVAGAWAAAIAAYLHK